MNNNDFPKVVFYMGFEADIVEQKDGFATYVLDNGMKMTVNKEQYDSLKERGLIEEISK